MLEMSSDPRKEAGMHNIRPAGRCGGHCPVPRGGGSGARRAGRDWGIKNGSGGGWCTCGDGARGDFFFLNQVRERGRNGVNSIGGGKCSIG